MSLDTKRLFERKAISVWGIGYLGYTTVLRLQSKGFFVTCSTFDKTIEKDIQKDEYPYEYMKQAWSLNNDIPRIDLAKTAFSNELDSMFESAVHVIAIPAFVESGKPEMYEKLVHIFAKNIDKLKGALIVFQSAEKAGTVENHFIKPLKKLGAKCYFGSAFRSDWSIEEFLLGNETRMIAGHDKESLCAISEFFEILNIQFETLDSIEEAEIYENAKNCLQYNISAFFTQLSFAYPGININKVSTKIIENIDLKAKQNGLNLLNHKNMLHMDHILAGQTGDYLSLIKETQAVNMTTVLLYADILKQKKVSSVTVMGLSVEGARKDIRGSAAVLLAEYLNSIGINVYVNDPYFTDSEINEILPFAKVSSMGLKAENTDGYVLMNSTPTYKYFTQADIKSNGLFEGKIIIDSFGILKHLIFSANTIYHEVGDGSLKVLLK